MDRSLYPEGVEVHQSDLKHTEDTRSFHILQRHIDNTFPGVVAGLSVTPNTGNPALLDVEAGYGYTSDGELAELESGITAVSLANSSVGVENLVVLVYTESYDRPQPHETSGDSFPTEANRSVRLRVFTRAQYDALPESDDNFDNDARNRTLIAASVIAQGSGVSIPSSAIQLPPIFGSAINIANLTNNVTGVTISSAEAGTANGNGTLVFNFNDGTLTWTAPDDTTGNPVNVLDGGFFELESFPSNKTLTVFVSSAILPVSNQTDTIQVQNLYYEDAPRHSSNDIHHRSLVGSGVPTPNNPHGLTLSDLGISGTPIEEHQTLMHSNGIRRDSDITTLQAVVNTGASPDELSITVGPNFYVYLRGTLFISSNQTAVPMTDVVDNTQILFEIFAKNGPNSQTDIEKRERVRFDTLSTLTTYVQLRDLSEGTVAGAGQIAFTTASNLLTYTAPGDSAGPAKAIPSSGSLPMRLFSNNGIDYIDLLVSSSLGTFGDLIGPLTISDRPTTNELKDRLHICTVVYSGAATGFLGNGFGVNNAPNEVLDKRLFGITAPFDIRDDAALWFDGETDEAESPASITHRQVGILDPNYDGPNVVNYALGRAQLTVVGKAHTYGRSTEQYGIFSAAQYSTAEDGLKQGIRSDVILDFGSGTMANAVGLLSLVRGQHVGGTVTTADSLWGRVDVDSGANVGNAIAVHAQAPGGTHSAATEITNAYGIKVENQSRGVNNWAVHTGVGRVHFGDRVEVEDTAFYLELDGSNPRIVFDTASQVDRLEYVRASNELNAYIAASNIWSLDVGGFDFGVTERTNIRWGANATRDGSTNPNADGARIGYAGSGLQAIVNATGNVPNNFLLIEKTDSGQTAPDGAIVLANTGNDGIIDASLIGLGNGNFCPGFNNAQDWGLSGQQWNNVRAANLRGDLVYGLDKNAFRTPSTQTYLIGFSGMNCGQSQNGFQGGQSRCYGQGRSLYKLDIAGYITIPCGGFKGGKLTQVHVYWTKFNMFQAFNIRVRMWKRAVNFNGSGSQVATEFNTGVTDALTAYDTVFNINSGTDQDIDETTHFYVQWDFTSSGWAAGDNEPMVIHGGRASVQATIITPEGFVG